MELVRLDVRSPHDIWALESTTEEDFVLHWDGNEQHVIAASSETLDDIAPISTSNIVGVGWSEYDKTYPNITHWNGERWRTTKTPLNNLRNTTMEGLYQVSPNDTWAVGAHLIARYSCAST